MGCLHMSSLLNHLQAPAETRLLNHLRLSESGLHGSAATSWWWRGDTIARKGVKRGRRGVGPAHPRGMPVAEDPRGICGAADRLGWRRFRAPS
jgi:hypothetical protein